MIESARLRDPPRGAIVPSVDPENNEQRRVIVDYQHRELLALLTEPATETETETATGTETETETET